MSLGFGRIPDSLDGGPVRVRQGGVAATGAFLVAVLLTMAAAVLHDPGIEGGGTNAFLDRWIYAAIIVPALYGIWRFLVRPQIVVDDGGVRLDNAFSTVALPWADIDGARLVGGLEVVGTDGDCARALIYSPTLSGPMTSARRPQALITLIRTEATRRPGRTLTDEYAASNLVSEQNDDLDAPYVAPDPVIHPRRSLGLPGLAVLFVAWTIACAIAAALA